MAKLPNLDDRQAQATPLRIPERFSTVTDIAKPNKLDDPQAHAAALSIPERLLQFCVARRTDWERAGIIGAAETAMLIKALIERNLPDVFIPGEPSSSRRLIGPDLIAHTPLPNLSSRNTSSRS